MFIDEKQVLEAIRRNVIEMNRPLRDLYMLVGAISLVGVVACILFAFDPLARSVARQHHPPLGKF